MSGMPRHEDFPTYRAYLLAWYTWRAFERDGRLTDEERAAQFEVKEAHIRRLFEERTP